MKQPLLAPPGPAGGGLLGNDPLAVTLVGTSYSADRRWNFAGALEEVLGAEVLNLADEGRGPFEPLQVGLQGLEPA